MGSKQKQRTNTSKGADKQGAGRTGRSKPAVPAPAALAQVAQPQAAPAPPHVQAMLQAQQTVGNRAAQSLMVQRDTIRDASGTFTDYEFRPGQELTADFLSLARRLAADGSISDNDLRLLRNEALGQRETVSDPERMFMAGMRDAANVAVFNGTAAGAAFRFPASRITQDNMEYVSELDRELPDAVREAHNEASEAYLSGGLVGMVEQIGVAEGVAAESIVDGAGPFKFQAQDLLDYVIDNGLNANNVVVAMVNAASDNDIADRIFAGMVYAIAKTANHALAQAVFLGDIKVDAMSAGAMASTPGFSGGEVAAYVPIAQPTGVKGDTMYVQTDLNPGNTFHRSVVIHELQHAVDDQAGPASGSLGFPAKNQLEVNAYRSQALYIYDQLEAQSRSDRTISGVEIAGETNQALMYAFLLEAKADLARCRPLLDIIIQQVPAASRPTTSQIDALIGLPVAELERRLSTVIDRMYGLTPGQMGAVDSLSGESVLDWANRV